ncbi:hypothetical protein ACFY2W_36330 [Streptomyces sp. NPDC001262]|uniref:hypothetical protein n=1 Tax=Streptomyces sp. NPDC001262 TaxID=3364552 RepID=UPI0036A5A327
MQRYEAEVTIRTATGTEVTYRGDGIGPDDVTTDQLLDGAAAAALAQEPGGQIVSSRVRRDH